MTYKAKLKPFTFPNSGETVYLPRVSIAALTTRLGKKFKPPQPPIQVIDYGNGQTVTDTNYSHPDYKQAMVHYRMFLQNKAEELLQARLLTIRLNDEQKETLAAWKEENPELWDGDDSDVDLYLYEIAIEGDEDFAALLDFLNSDPGLEAVESMVDGFRGQVQGPADNGVDDSAERGDD